MDLTDDWNKYAILIPDEKDLTVPVAPATELSKLYMLLKNLTGRYLTDLQTDDEGKLILPQDLKWLMNQMRMTLTSVGSMVKDIQSKTTDQKIKLLDIFQKSNDGELPPEIQEQVMESMFGGDANRKSLNQD